MSVFGKQINNKVNPVSSINKSTFINRNNSNNNSNDKKEDNKEDKGFSKELDKELEKYK